MVIDKAPVAYLGFYFGGGGGVEFTVGIFAFAMVQFVAFWKIFF